MPAAFFAIDIRRDTTRRPPGAGAPLRDPGHRDLISDAVARRQCGYVLRGSGLDLEPRANPGRELRERCRASLRHAGAQTLVAREHDGEVRLVMNAPELVKAAVF